MAGTQFDLEAIVREVVRQLQHELPPSAPVAPAADDAPPPRRTDRPSVPRNVPGTLEVSERVVTWAGLKDRLSGVRRLIVPAGAVITPSVRDELRKRNIPCTVAVQASISGEVRRTDLLIAAACGAYEARESIEAVAAETVSAERIGCGAVAEIIDQLRVRIRRDGTPGVLVTTEPAGAVCLANRFGELRAVWPADEEAVAESCRSVGANLLVLDPRRSPADALRSMVRQFLQGSHRCPADWQGVLAGGNER